MIARRRRCHEISSSSRLLSPCDVRRAVKEGVSPFEWQQFLSYRDFWGVSFEDLFHAAWMSVQRTRLTLILYDHTFPKELSRIHRVVDTSCKRKFVAGFLANIIRRAIVHSRRGLLFNLRSDLSIDLTKSDSTRTWRAWNFWGPFCDQRWYAFNMRNFTEYSIVVFWRSLSCHRGLKNSPRVEGR